MSPEIRCLFPDLGVMVGYAVTARILANQPPDEGYQTLLFDYWDYVSTGPEPRVVVIQDLDQPLATESYWGEVNGNINRALGCVGVVTNGGVRDLDEVHALGFHFFAAQVLVSHGYAHVVDFGTPVNVGGIIISAGDLLHADKHGVVVIPHEVARRVTTAAATIEATERRIINYCKSPEFSAGGLKVLWQETRSAK